MESGSAPRYIKSEREEKVLIPYVPFLHGEALPRSGFCLRNIVVGTAGSECLGARMRSWEVKSEEVKQGCDIECSWHWWSQTTFKLDSLKVNN